MAIRRTTRLFPEQEQRDYDWAFANWGQLAKRYPNQWVAVAHRRVIAAGPRLNRVLEQAHQQVEWEHVPHVFVESGVVFYAHRC